MSKCKTPCPIQVLTSLDLSVEALFGILGKGRPKFDNSCAKKCPCPAMVD